MVFSATILRPLTSARTYAKLSLPKKQIRRGYFNRTIIPKKSRAKNNTNLDLPSWFVLFLYGARDGTRKERSDGIAIVARSADRVSHRERVPSRQRETPHSIWGVALVQSKGLEPIRFPIGT